MCFLSGKLPWKWISGGHLSSELQDLFRLETFVKTAFPHFPWSSYIEMTVSRKLLVKSTKTMGAIVQSISFRTFLGAPTLK